MKERPILFSGAMVRALLAGTKTQTRRLKGLEYFSENEPDNWRCVRVRDGIAYFVYKNSPVEREVRFPHGKPGDRLYVRETWQHSNWPHGPYDEDCDFFYRADYFDDPHGPDGELSPEGKYRTWKPSIHMPRAVSRILLEITGLRVERLDDISDADACAEGIGCGPTMIGMPMTKPDLETIPHFMFRELWESINGAGSWAVNPWVWVVEFKRVTP